VKTIKYYSPKRLPKVGDKMLTPMGKIKTITLFDMLAALGGSNLPKEVDRKTWNKFDRFFHGFLTTARLQKSASGRKTLEDLNIEVGTGPMNMDQIIQNHKQLNKEAA